MVSVSHEEPFAAVVARGRLKDTCSYCFDADSDVTPCRSCRTVSYCSPRCAKLDTIHKVECRLMKSFHPNLPNERVRLIARILLKPESELAKPAFNGVTWDSVEAHVAEIAASEDLTYKDFIFHVTYVERFLSPLEQKFSLEEIELVVGKVWGNYIQIYDKRSIDKSLGFGFYLGFSAQKHSCIPDATLVFNGRTAILRSVTHSKYSKNLTICHRERIPFSQPVAKNLRKLRFGKCTCMICTDKLHILNRTGTSCYVPCCEGAVGHLFGDEYRCIECSFLVAELTEYDVKRAMERISEFLGDVKANSNPHDMMRVALKLQFEYSKVLSPLNYAMVDIRDFIERVAVRLSNMTLSEKMLEENLIAYQYYFRIGDMSLTRFIFALANRKFHHPVIHVKDYEIIEKALNLVRLTFGEDHLIYKAFSESHEIYKKRMLISHMRNGLQQ